MEDQIVTNNVSSHSLDLDTIHSRISELKNMNLESVHENGLCAEDSEEKIRTCAVELETKLNQIRFHSSDIASLSVDELDLYVEHLKGELTMVEAESANISNEVEDLKRTYLEDSSQLESNLEGLEYSIGCIPSQGLGVAKAGADLECSINDNQTSLLPAKDNSQFKILELSTQIEKSEKTLKSLQDLDNVINWFDALEKIEDALTGFRVIEVGKNNIKLSLRTYAPNLENLLSQHKLEDIIDPFKQTHEMVVELVDGTMELKNAEIFPGDVHINDIIDASKSFRKLYSEMPSLETRSPLEWFIRKVQERIVMSRLRQLVVKSANNSRHSFEYLERDETIVAHMVGGIDAFIKVSQGWPIHDSPLKLVSLKNSSPNSKEISLSFLCKVEEAANSLDKNIQQNISTFVEAIEEILVQCMRVELQSPDTSRDK